MSKIEVNKIIPRTGTTLSLGDSGDTLTLTSGAKTSGFGKIGQVVKNSSTTTKTSSTHSSQTELINASITPTSTTSKIFILINVPMQTTASSNSYSSVKVFKGTLSGTSLGEYYFGSASASNRNDLYSINIIDEPSTTSSQQYTVGIRKGSSATSSVSTDGGRYEIILMEILD